jgi:hypothetical protein
MIAQIAEQDLLTTAHQDQTTPQDVSGQTNHAMVRVSQTVQPKRAGQTSLPMETETLLQDHLTRETQDLLNPEGMKLEDHASLQDHQIVAMEQDQVLDTDQIHLSAQLAMIAASVPIVQPVISQAIRSAALQETRQELTSHVQTRESMTATVTHTAKTECQEISLVTQALLALATRTQTVKHSLRTKF